MTKTTVFNWRTMQTPVTPLTIVWGPDGLIQADFTDNHGLAKNLARHKLGQISEQQTPDSPFEQALARYFSGELDILDEIPTAPIGTEFSRQVWQQLCLIPAGATRTYGEIAQTMNRRGAARAVGMACHNNPIGLVVPCHRVVGHNSSLIGYAGGVHIKKWLLRHEGVEIDSPDGGQIRLFA
jgi:methylated-DNA-[protein]-cysteine S-methyltransferase